MGLDVATEEERNDRKKKKQKTMSVSSVSTEVETEETLAEVVRRETKTKKKHDPIPLEKEKTPEKGSKEESEHDKSERVGTNDPEKDQYEEDLGEKEVSQEIEENFNEKVHSDKEIAEKVQFQEEQGSRALEKGSQEASNDERTITDRKSESNHSSSKEVMAPLTKVYTRGKTREVWKPAEQEAKSILVQRLDFVADGEELNTPERMSGGDKSGEKTEELNLNSSGEHGSERTVVLEGITSLQ